MKNSVTHYFILFGMIAFSASSKADHHEPVDTAKVIEAAPIYREISDSVPRQRCWLETRIEQAPHKHDSATPLILGGVLGGAVGSAIGSQSDHRDAGKLLGAIIGLSIGNDVRRQQSKTRPIEREYERCETHYVESHSQAIIGYDVSYRYAGRIYQTRTREHPGKHIPVRVSVTPAGYH